MDEPQAEPRPLDHNDLIAGKAILHATVTITRAATGKQETYEITGTPVKEDEPCQ